MARSNGLLEIIALSTLTFVACGDDDPAENGEGSGGLEIAGVWASNFGSEEVITEAGFNAADIREYDNDQNIALTQNPADAEFNPGLFNRIVWTEPTGDTFHYCFTDFGLDSLEAARAADTEADASDPDAGGCGGFPWTRLRRAISIRGEYESNFDGLETVTATVWQQGGAPMRLVDWDETENWVVTQNDDEADFNPGLFNRIEFTEPDASGSFYYCFVEFGLSTADEARDSTATADASDPETTGCGGFPWTRLDPR